MDQGTTLIDDIIKLVADSVARPDGTLDLEEAMAGMACAYSAFALAFHTEEQAKELLVELADVLDHPQTVERIKTMIPGWVWKTALPV